MQSFKFLILSAFISIVLGCNSECDIISEQVCSLSKFSYLDSLVTTQMMNVTDFSAHSYWMYLNEFDKKMYETVVQPAFCSKVLGLPSHAVCNLDEYIITEAIQLHVDNNNYNVFVSLIVNIGIRMSRNGFRGSIINVFNDIVKGRF